MERASVIVPAYNAAATIGATLDALARQDVETAYEVIVVDDGSSDGTPAVVESAGATLLRLDRGGPGAARNLGVRHAAGRWLAFTDADCVPARSWLREGIDALADADLVQGAVHPDPAVPRRPFDRTVWVTRESGLFECASLFVRRELFDGLGGFEDWLGARIGKELAEDAWLGWRARRAGARIRFSERALVHHAVFRRPLVEYAAERARSGYFPAIVRQIPELRRELLYRGLFLNRRTVAFDAGLLGVVAALGAGSPVPLLLAGPYGLMTARDAARWGRHAPRAALGELAADAVAFAALFAGSVRSRSPVL